MRGRNPRNLALPAPLRPVFCPIARRRQESGGAPGFVTSVRLTVRFRTPGKISGGGYSPLPRTSSPRHSGCSTFGLLDIRRRVVPQCGSSPPPSAGFSGSAPVVCGRGGVSRPSPNVRRRPLRGVGGPDVRSMLPIGVVASPGISGRPVGIPTSGALSPPHVERKTIPPPSRRVLCTVRDGGGHSNPVSVAWPGMRGGAWVFGMGRSVGRMDGRGGSGRVAGRYSPGRVGCMPDG